MKPLMASSVPFIARRSMAAAAFGEHLYFFGGVGANQASESILDVSNDLWRFDPVSRRWSQIPYAATWPEPRRCVGWLARPDGILLWGGSGITAQGQGHRHTFLNDEWLFDPATSTWRQIEESDDHLRPPAADDAGRSRPGPRYTPVIESIGDQLILFGGYTEDAAGKRQLNDTWVRDGRGWTLVPPTDAPGYDFGATYPAPRYGCMHAADQTHLYICGGASQHDDHMDVWRFDVARGSWELLASASADPAPSPRYCAALTLSGDDLVLFGGRSRWKPKLNYNDLWLFNLRARQWRCIQPNSEPHDYSARAPRPAYHAKSAVARMGDWLYIWGGEGRQGHVSDFWRLQLGHFQWDIIQPAREDDPILW